METVRFIIRHPENYSSILVHVDENAHPSLPAVCVNCLSKLREQAVSEFTKASGICFENTADAGFDETRTFTIDGILSSISDNPLQLQWRNAADVAADIRGNQKSTLADFIYPEKKQPGGSRTPAVA